MDTPAGKERPPPEIRCVPVGDEGRDLEGIADGMATPQLR